MTHGRIPALTLGWRLQMALGEISAQEMADNLGVSRATVSRWMHDKGAPPRRAYIAQWAMATGVPVEWLEHGNAPQPGRPGGEQWAPWGSNPQPTGYASSQVRTLQAVA